MAIWGGIETTAFAFPRADGSCRPLHETNPRAQPMQQRGRTRQALPTRPPLRHPQRLHQLPSRPIEPHRPGDSTEHRAPCRRQHLHHVPTRRLQALPPPPHRPPWHRGSRGRRRLLQRLPLHRPPAPPQHPRQQLRQDAPRRPTPRLRAAMNHDPNHLPLPVTPHGPIAISMHMQHAVAAPRTALGPVPLRITQPPGMLLKVSDPLGDQRPAFLAGRIRTDQARCRSRRRESILAHGALRRFADSEVHPTFSPFSTPRSLATVPGHKEPRPSSHSAR